MLRFFYWPAVGPATQELQEIIDHAQENASGNYLKTREVFRDLHRAARELKEAGD